MRLFLAAVLVAVGATTVGWASAPAGGSSVGSARAQLPVSYLYHAKFTIEYEVDWMTQEGSSTRECSTWRADRGSSRVFIEDAPWVQTVTNKKTKKKRKIRRTDGIAGSIRIPGTSPAKGVRAIWAGGAAVGRATASVSRTWVQQGGVNWDPGCGSRPDPFRPSPSDCGTRTVTSRTATFLPGTRKRFETLYDLVHSEGAEAAFAFSMPARAPYKTCKTHGAAPGLPANFGFWIGSVDVRDLRKADPGTPVPSIHAETSGDCTFDLSADESCTFRLELNLDVHPWEPGTPYP